MISRYLSNKIKLLSFVLILIIVLLHSQMINISTGINLHIQQFFNLGFTRIGVPMFFMISGFLFFYNVPDKPGFYFFFKKISSRIDSLFIPFILWTLIGMCFVRIVLPIPAFTSFFENISINKSFLCDFFYSFIIPYKVVYQLWFVRDLFVMALFSPLIFILVKKIPVIYFISLELLYIYSLPFIQVSSIMSFSIGVFIALYHKEYLSKFISARISLILFFLWLFLCILLVYIKIRINTLQFIYIQQFINYFGIISIWLFYDVVYKFIPDKIFKSSILSMSFWIFLTHEPVLTIIKKILLRCMGNNDFSILCIYILSPILTIVFVFLIGILLRKYFRLIYSVLVGGRV